MINSSCIKVFTYEVLINNDTFPEGIYSFGKFRETSEKTNKPIQSKEFRLENRKTDFLFSKNILENVNNENNNESKTITTSNETTTIESRSNNFANNSVNNSVNNININLKNKLFDELLLLYEEYYTYLGRQSFVNFKSLTNNNLYSRLKEKIYNNLPKLLLDSMQIMESYLANNIKNEETEILFNNLNKDDEIIIKINAINNSKIIILGDQHGSFHSFFRVIIRLILQGIITKNYKLHPDYKIIFLGDIVDRGNYGVEIMYIILQLFIANNTINKLNVILNRGNHEELSTFREGGFLHEFKHKIENKGIQKKFTYLFKYCPSAIILTQNNIKYWLCHGGFPINFENLSKTTFNFNDTNNVYINNNMKIGPSREKISEIRWNDFINRDKYSNSERGDNIYNIGKNKLVEFLKKYNINFIIRGHTDNENNAMVLMNTLKEKITPKKDWYHINRRTNISHLNRLSNLITYLNLHENNKTIKNMDEIATIHPKNFIINETKKKIETELCPVLTISNCCDIGRQLYNDSYVIIESKEYEEQQSRVYQLFSAVAHGMSSLYLFSQSPKIVPNNLSTQSDITSKKSLKIVPAI